MVANSEDSADERSEAVEAWLGQVPSQGVSEDPDTPGRLKTQLTATRLLALSTATLVHLVTLAAAAGGLALIGLNWPSLLALASGLFLLALAWRLRPRLGKLPAGLLPAQDYPHLYRLVERVAGALHAPRIRGLWLELGFSGSYFQGGLPGQRYMSIGLPLWSILTAQEKVALLAHESAHGINGDVARGTYVKTALSSLHEWDAIIRQNSDLARRLHRWDVGVVFPFTLLTLLVGGLVVLVNRLLTFLVTGVSGRLAYWLHRDSQRAEYLADYLASEVSGREAMVTLLYKVQLDHRLGYIVPQMVHHPRGMMAEFRKQAAQLSAAFLEQGVPSGADALSREVVGYPRLIDRIHRMRRRGPVTPKVELDAEWEAAIEAELSPHTDQLDRALVEGYIAVLEAGVSQAAPNPLAQRLMQAVVEVMRVRAELAAPGEVDPGFGAREEEANRRSAAVLEAILDEVGWPGRSVVGEDGAQAAMLIVKATSGSPALQRRCLPLLQAAAARGDADPAQAAFLEDRICFSERRPQRYGTYFVWDADGQWSPWTLADPAQVEALRASVGLGPLAEQVAEARREAGSPPPDLAAKQAELDAWLKEVGWISGAAATEP